MCTSPREPRPFISTDVARSERRQDSRGFRSTGELSEVAERFGRVGIAGIGAKPEHATLAVRGPRDGEGALPEARSGGNESRSARNRVVESAMKPDSDRSRFGAGKRKLGEAQRSRHGRANATRYR